MNCSKVKKYKSMLLDSGNAVTALLIALIIGGIMVMIVGESPVVAYRAILRGAFGSSTGFANTIRYTIQVLLLAYSFSICNNCGYFNIAQEAQMYSASIALLFISYWTTGMPSAIRWILMVLGACVAGAVTCLIPALTKYKLGVNEVVTGVMLNYLTRFVCQHLIAFSPIAEKKASSIISIQVPERLPIPIITVGAACIVVLYIFVLKCTIPGYRLTITGKNEKFAKASGINATKVLIISAIVGGTLSAFCCIGDILGYYHVIYNEFAAGMGNDGMTAAFLGGNNALGIVFGSLLLGALKSGSVTLSILTNVPTELIDCIQGLIMFFATIKFFRDGSIHWRLKKEKK